MENIDFDRVDLSQLSPQEVETKAVWRDRRGDIIGRVGILLSIYYVDGWRREKRDGLIQIANEFLRLFHDRIGHYQKEDSRRLTRWDRAGVPKDYLELAHKTTRKTSFYVHFIERTDANAEDPELCRMMAFGADELAPWRPLSVVNCHIPPTWFYQNVEEFVETVNRWCGLVQCAHGSAGLGVLSNSGTELQVEPSHYFLLKRYPGLEFDAVGSYLSETAFGGSQAYRRPRSSNWLTMIGEDNLALLGGPHEVARRLKAGMEFLGYPGGAMIRAGQSPRWGDSSKGDVPELYRAAASIIKPIRFEDYKFGFIKVPEPLNYTDESLKWLRRFD